MRNWHNLIKYFQVFVSTTSCTLPMRNWHLFVVQKSGMGFIRSAVPCLWGIDTLRLIYFLSSSSGNHVVPYLWGIDTKFFCCFFHYVSCCTLPMRNWHISVAIAAGILSPSYTLPMRNWHMIFSTASIIVTKVLYRTYKELTHYYLLQIYVPFSLYLA